MQAAYQLEKLKDPRTGMIPAGMRARELEFVAGLPSHAAGEGQDWNARGPANLGGRMLCIAIDIDNEEHFLAGSASGGTWESKTHGLAWSKTTSPDAEQSATCIVQDKRPGKHSTWYYGTGELLSTTDRNISTNARTIGIGNGIYKSTDNGSTWQPLTFTQSGSPAHLSEIFQGVWRIVTDPVRLDKDIVYAACYGAIMRSEDGGAHWTVTLGDVENKSFCTDLAITSDGVIYAALSGFGFGVQPPAKQGIWRSVDGLNWTKITPEGFPVDNRVTRLAIAPSNQKVMYVFTESQSPDLTPLNGYTNSVNTFWKMTWNSSAGAAGWENRTSGIPGAGNGSINSFPFSMVVYGGYCFAMGVRPDNENDVFIGGLNMHRSVNGFADSLHTTYIGGYPYDMDSVHQLHPDMHAITFLPSNPDVMFVANDGGIYKTFDCMADSSLMTWQRMNFRLTTSQFYSITIDHGASGDDWILGGLQDNNWYYSVTDNPAELWLDINICYDGFASAVARNWEYSVITAYCGNLWTCRFDNNMHAIDIFPQLPDTLLKYYDPVMGSNSLFPFYQNMAIDPVSYRTFYLPTITSIWRKDDMKAAAYDSGLRNAGWSHLSNVDVGAASQISYLAVSTIPANRIYYGTNFGKVFRLDNANTGNPVPAEVTGSNFPPNAFVAFVDIDPANADNVMVTFSNYGVRSIFYSSDGGTAWTPVSGNLEASPDGSGAGPSVRCTKQMSFQGHKVYFAGTSSGLFSTTELKGDSTVWKREGVNTIGNVIVDMIDARETDGFIAIATHGNGVYSTYYNPSAGIGDHNQKYPWQVTSVFPNPSTGPVTVALSAQTPVPMEISLFDLSGKFCGSLSESMLNGGDQKIQLSLAGRKPGVYWMRFSVKGQVQTKKIVLYS